MTKKQTPHNAGRGVRKAAAYYPERVAEALKEFRQLNTREARSAFADHWIGLWAREFDDAWPMLYELLEIVKDDELYRDPRRVGPKAGGGPETHGAVSEYPDFAAYFEDRVRQPFQTWADLEHTYRYVQDYAPELLRAKYQVAEKARSLADKTINSGDGPLSKEEHANPDIIRVSGTTGGTSNDYLIRRIVRDHPAIAERMEAGEFRSARAAALEAGIIHQYQSVRMDDADSAARTLRRYMKPDQRARLAQLLTDDKGES